ncbi:MAG: calcium/sodium antiporter [Actinomycetia bacterium]|nr:calcium/sodium antiporter [Actinomycetes bacterium]MCP5032796.1 calcium/sodium antiporter [Actinomycetes bacterium]
MQTLSEPGLVLALIEVVIGIALLGRAADEFVEGAASVAKTARVSPVLVGAVIVGFGTSAPELLVSGIAAVNGDLDLGVGNIIGSNVANLTLVLGSAALIIPLLVTRAVLVREAPLSLLAVLLFAYLTTGGLERWEGVLLITALGISIGWLIIAGVGDARLAHRRNPNPRTRVPKAKDSLRTIVGLIGTIIGAQLLVWGASAVASEAGLSGGFVGFTLVAVGTSLPELVTAVVCARKGATDLLLGNLLGSNLFNSLAVGGVIALVGPGTINDRGLRTVGVIVMVVVAVGAWAFMVTLKRVHRLEGIVLLVSWVIAVALLARTATETAMLGWLPF